MQDPLSLARANLLAYDPQAVSSICAVMQQLYDGTAGPAFCTLVEHDQAGLTLRHTQPHTLQNNIRPLDAVLAGLADAPNIYCQLIRFRTLVSRCWVPYLPQYIRG